MECFRCGKQNFTTVGVSSSCSHRIEFEVTDKDWLNVFRPFRYVSLFLRSLQKQTKLEAIVGQRIGSVVSHFLEVTLCFSDC